MRLVLLAVFNFEFIKPFLSWVQGTFDPVCL